MKKIRIVSVLLLAALLLSGCESIIIPPNPPRQTTEGTQTPDEPHDPAGTIKDTEPPVTNPPATNPPVTNPPVTNPPVTNPPVTEPPVTEPPHGDGDVLLWHPTKSGDGLEATVEKAGTEPAELIRLLGSAGVIPKRTEVISCKLSSNGRKLTLDLSSDFASFIKEKTPAESMLAVGSVVNTFLAATGAETVTLTAGGAVIPSEGKLYDRELPFFDLTEHEAVDLKKGKYVSITFDDGPHSSITVKIAEKLREKGARATFFVVGNRVNGKTAAAMQYAAIEGSEIAIHGYTHTVKYSKCTDEEYKEELSLTDAVIRKYVPGPVTLMRPIGGSILKERIASCPYTVINWNVDSEDWKNKSHKTPEETEANIETTVNNVKAQVKNGSIILMHEIYDNSYEAFCRIIDWLYEEGYEVVTVSELLGSKCVPGVRYFNA